MRRQFLIPAALGLLLGAFAVGSASRATAAERYETIGFPMVNEGAAYFADSLPNGFELAARVAEGERGLDGATFALQLPSHCLAYFSGYTTPGKAPEVASSPSGRETTYRFPCGAGRQFVLTGVIIPRGIRSGGQVRWWLEVDGQRIAEQAYAIEAVRIPPGKSPKRLIIGLFAAQIANAPEEVLDRAASFVSRCGVNLVWDYDSRRAPAWRKYGIKVAIEEAGYAGVGNFPKGDSPVAPALYADGSKKGTCPTYVLEHPEETLAEPLRLARGMASTHDLVSWDWEHTAGMMGGDAPDWCFDERCLDAFEKWSGISLKGMSPQEIVGKYHAEWRAWHNHLLTERMRILYGAAHASNPNVRIAWLPGNGVTTNPDDPDTRLGEQILWHRNQDGTPQYLVYCPWPRKAEERYYDVFMPMYYYYGLDSPRYLLEQVEAVRKTLPTEFAVTLVGQGDLYEKSMVECDPGLTRMQLLACAVGGAGASFYPVNWGARHWEAVAHASREIAEAEDFLLDGKRDPSLCRLEPLDTRFIETPGQRFPSPPAERHLLTRSIEHKGRRLLAVFNFDLDRPAFYRAAFPGLKGDWAICDLSRQLLVAPRHDRPYFTAEELEKGVILTTPADWGVSLYLLLPKGEAPLLPSVLEAQIERLYRRSLEVVHLPGGGTASGQPCRIALVETDQGPRLKMENEAQVMLVDYDKGARVSEWRAGGHDLTKWVEDTTWNGGLCNDQFWVPTSAHFAGDSKSVYELVAYGVDKQGAYATFRRRLLQPLLAGLVITKTFHIAPKQTGFDLAYTYANESGRPLTFTPWLHHQVAVGVEEAARRRGGTGFEHSQLRFPGDKGTALVPPLPNGIWKVPGAGFTSWQNEQFEINEQEHLNGGWAELSNMVTGERIRFDFDYAEVFELLSWSSLWDMTLEWCYKVRTLQPGESWSTTATITYLPQPRD